MMMKIGTFARQARRKHTGFNPTRSFILKSVEEYLDRGGKITMLIIENSHYNMQMTEGSLLEQDDYVSNRFNRTEYQMA
jgi:hypothetical protein